MADLKISQMTVADTPLAGAELIPIVQDGVNKSTSVDSVRTGLIESDIADITGASIVANIVLISQSNYELLAVKDPNTVYVII